MNKGKHNKKALVGITLASTLLLSAYSPVFAATSTTTATTTTSATTTSVATYSVQPYSATGVVINSPNRLNMRLGPGTTYAIKGALDNGQVVNIVGKTTSWYKLANGLFVYSAYIRITATTTVITTTQPPVVAITDPTIAEAKSAISTAQAIENYSKYMDAYLAHDQKIVDLFRARETKSQADQLVERAIWYMENGYSVYGHAYKGYKDYGIWDCSNFTSLIYSDFGYNITTASRQYNTVGRKVSGVYSTVIGTNQYTGQKLYGIVGLDKLQPGDLFTFWAKDASGNKYISHTAIYVGTFNGKPAIIGTTAKRPTSLGIVDDFRYWYGSNLFEVRRVLPDNAEQVFTYTKNAPVIPKAYVLPPQKPIVMPK